MDITSTRKAIIDALSSISGLELYATVPDSPIVPCAIIYPESLLYQETFDGIANGTFIIHVLSASVDANDGQEVLDSYLAPSGPLSIRQAVDENLGTLGAAWVTEVREYGTIQLNDGGSRFYSAQLVLEIHA